jgi:hypothetical protein
MSNKKSNKLTIVIALIIITLFLIGVYYFSQQNKNRQEKIRLKLDALNCERKILCNHLEKNESIETKIRQQSEKLRKIFVRILVLSYIIFNLLYLLISGFNFTGMSKVNGFIFIALNILWLILFGRVFILKRVIEEELNGWSYKIISKNRDAKYFGAKKEEINNRIAQIDLEINQLKILLDSDYKE